MSTAKTPAAAPAKTEKVKLAKAHRHAGKDLPPGEEITVDEATAKWLRDNGVVEKATSDAPAAAR